jgi:general stress protein YciG
MEDIRSPEYAEKLRKREETIIKRYGSLEAYKEAAKEWGTKGGNMSPVGWHTRTPEQRSEAGKKGHQAMLEKLKDELRKEVSDENSEG